MKSTRPDKISLSVHDDGGNQVGCWNAFFPAIRVEKNGKVIKVFQDSFKQDVKLFDEFLLVRRREPQYPATNDYWGVNSTQVVKEQVYIIDKKTSGLKEPMLLDDFLKIIVIKC